MYEYYEQYNAKEELSKGVKETYEMQEKVLSKIKELKPEDVKGRMKIKLTLK